MDQSQGQQGYKEQAQVNDEIDLRELFSAVWNTRKALIVVLIVVACVFWGMLAASKLAMPPVQIYQKQIDFVFAGVEAGRYPSDAEFRLADVLAPAVLRRVYDKRELAVYGFGLEQFVGGFNITPYAPQAEGILAKHKARLNQKGVSGAEIAEINLQLAQDLKSAQQGSAIIRLTLPPKASLPKGLAETLMHDVPAEWSRYMIDEKGVAKFGVPLYSENILDGSLFESLDYFIAYDLLLDKISSIKSNITELVALPGSEAVTDPVTGLSLQDLTQALADLSNYDIEAIWLPIQNLGVSANPEVVKYYFQNKLLELQQKREELQKKAAITADTYESYANKGSRENAGTGQAGLVSGNVIPQFSGEFLGRLMEMGGAGGDQAYRQKLSDQRIEYSNEAAEVELQIVKVKAILAAMKSVGGNKKQSDIRAYYQQQAETQLPLILEKLKRYIRATHSIHEKLSKNSFGYVGLLYRDTGGVSATESGSVVTKATIRNFVLLMVLVVFLTIPVVMLRHSMQRLNSEKAQAQRAKLEKTA